MEREISGLYDDEDSDVLRPGSISPTTSFSSDKENRGASETTGKNKRPSMGEAGASGAQKRQRTNGLSSQVAYRQISKKQTDISVYDPDQDLGERRKVRKGLRDLQRDLTDSRTEYLAPTSKGLHDTIVKANELFTDVKQTGDATLDSRLLISAGELVARRAILNKAGVSAPGVDLDELVGKCISFMRKGPGERAARDLGMSQSTQRRRAGSEEASDDEDTALNWEWLGRKACIPHSSRPAVPNFLLGPLSVEKKYRKFTQRTQRQQRRDPADAIRPEQIRLVDIEKTENSNLTHLCTKISALLTNYIEKSVAACEAEVIEAGGEDAVSQEEMTEILDRHAINTDCGVDLFKFAFHPTSFGQTVENIFYISFLIRDGHAGLMEDDRGVLYLFSTAPSTTEEFKKQNIVKKQVILHLDFETWRSVVTDLNLTQCIIPHRVSDQERQMGGSTWYA